MEKEKVRGGADMTQTIDEAIRTAALKDFTRGRT
jgi:hypothetical protein